jgi:hypothetical protein
MAIKRAAPEASVAEVLDRVLDRGIVIDAWLRVSVAGIALLDVDARIVVASIDTYVRHADAVARALQAPPPAPAERPVPRGRQRPRRPGVRLRCAEGCTFIRPAPHRPRRVRCASDQARTCPVTPLPAAA